MRVMVFAASPNKDGLTARCADAAAEGAREAGADAEIVWLNDAGVGRCQACGNGWGTCRTAHTCQVEDGFQALHRQVWDADGYVLVSPVYFGGLSESAKAFFDRLRRCEAPRGAESALAGKPVLGVAAAGGSGGGVASCLEEMTRLFGHLRCAAFDLITVTRKSAGYKPDAIRQAARAMVASAASE